MNCLDHEDEEVLAAIQRLKQAEQNDELWCDECRNYYPSEQVTPTGEDRICDDCRLKQTK